MGKVGGGFLDRRLGERIPNLGGQEAFVWRIAASYDPPRNRAPSRTRRCVGHRCFQPRCTLPSRAILIAEITGPLSPRTITLPINGS